MGARGASSTGPTSAMLVIGFLQGRALENADFADAGVLARAADACRRLHAGPAVHRRLRHVRRGRRRTSRRCGSAASRCRRRTTTTPTPGHDVRRALAADPRPTVPCNNDLLAGELHRRRRPGLADRLRVLRQQRRLLRARQHLHRVRLHARADRGVDRGLLRRADAAPTWPGCGCRRCAAQYGWSLWGFIQAATSPIDFDFHGWGLERFDKAEATFRGPELRRGCSRRSPRG